MDLAFKNRTTLDTHKGSETSRGGLLDLMMAHMQLKGVHAGNAQPCSDAPALPHAAAAI